MGSELRRRSQRFPSRAEHRRRSVNCREPLGQGRKDVDRHRRLGRHGSARDRVAEAVGLPFSLKRVRIKGAMRFVPARFQPYVSPAPLLRSVQSNEPLQPPWPRLVISIGPRGAPIALAIKRASGAFGLHIGQPKVPARLFDLVAAPVHDNVEGTNVSPRSAPCTA